MVAICDRRYLLAQSRASREALRRLEQDALRTFGVTLGKKIIERMHHGIRLHAIRIREENPHIFAPPR